MSNIIQVDITKLGFGSFIWYVVDLVWWERIRLRKTNTVKPICNDHLYDKIYYLWFIQ